MYIFRAPLYIREPREPGGDGRLYTRGEDLYIHRSGKRSGVPGYTGFTALYTWR